MAKPLRKEGTDGLIFQYLKGGNEQRQLATVAICSVQF